MSDPRRPTQNEATESIDVHNDASELRVLVSSPGGERIHALAGKRRVVLGRAEQCDIVLDDPAVSRRHVAIDLSGICFLEDLGSRNGTVLFGHTLRKGDRSPLPVGTSFTVGSATVVVQRRRPSGLVPDAAVVEDPAMRAIYELVDMMGASSLSVLVLGETGTGKEVLAGAIHARSRRAARTFLPINCAALAETLLESELFGHERGAFTGAVQPKTGLFEAANGGTVLLDEVGELAPTTQAKLLRVLESGEVTRLGSVKPVRIDVRFIAATNRDLASLVRAGGFRGDLFYRLNGFSVTLPPLRDRPSEILPLARRFAESAAARLERSVPTLGESASTALQEHSWPGNIRELRNVMERAVASCRGAASLTREHLALASYSGEPTRATQPPGRADRAAERLAADVDETTNPASDADSPNGGALSAAVGSFEKERVLDALRRATFNQTEAARALGISRRTLINKIVQYGIPRPRKGRA